MASPPAANTSNASQGAPFAQTSAHNNMRHEGLRAGRKFALRGSTVVAVGRTFAQQRCHKFAERTSAQRHFVFGAHICAMQIGGQQIGTVT